MSKSMLQRKIDSVNKRSLAGLNDDDQVAAMIREEKKTLGWHILPGWDTYSMVSAEEKLKLYVEKYGYWSDEVKYLNEQFIAKGGFDYMKNLNDPYIGSRGINKNI